MEKIHFAMCADKNMEVGLHTALFSLFSNMNSGCIGVDHIFLKGFSDDDFENIKSSMSQFSDNCEMVFYDVEGIDLGGGIGLHGNMMAYLLFHVPNIVKEERVLYLDADVIVEMDIGKIYDIDMGDNLAAVCFGSYLEWALPIERDFLASVGMEWKDNYFNSGVMLLNATAWRKEGMTEKCLEFSLKHGDFLYTADQTVLNALLKGKHCLLPPQCNVSCGPSDKRSKSDEIEGIYHFVGSPIPWDLMGAYLHVNYGLFHKYSKMTHLKGFQPYRHISVKRLKRMFEVKGGYYYAAKSAIKRAFIN